jgi:hypothetical protein
MFKDSFSNYFLASATTSTAGPGGWAVYGVGLR